MPAPNRRHVPSTESTESTPTHPARPRRAAAPSAAAASAVAATDAVEPAPTAPLDEAHALAAPERDAAEGAPADGGTSAPASPGRRGLSRSPSRGAHEPPVDPAGRPARYVEACERLGLPPTMQPLVVVLRAGRETFHATARATDELAARHRLRREVTVGPRVLTHGTSTLAHAVCRATHPDGRVATASVTLPFSNPEDALMTCETRAKRVATLRVLGLEAFADAERDVIPAGFTPVEPQEIALTSSPFGTVDTPSLPMREHPAATIAATDVPFRVVPANDVQDPARSGGPLAVAYEPGASAPLPAGEPASSSRSALDPLTRFLREVAGLTRLEAAVPLWLAQRGEIAPLSPLERTAAWNGLCSRVQQLGKMADPKTWLKQAVAEATSNAKR